MTEVTEVRDKVSFTIQGVQGDKFGTSNISSIKIK